MTDKTINLPSTMSIGPVRIHNVRYQMEIRGGGDIWRIHGEAENHPDIPSGRVVLPTNPKSYDRITKRFVTNSGRVYEIISFGQKEADFTTQIEKDIANGGFEYH